MAKFKLLIRPEMERLTGIDRAETPDRRCIQCLRYAYDLVNGVCSGCRFQNGWEQLGYDQDQGRRRGEM